MKNTFVAEEATKKALAEFILNSDKLSMGEQCFAFEKEFARTQERAHCVLFNSGGSANLAILQTAKNLGLIKDGDPVGFSALTWSTNTMPIIQLELTPVPVDCTKATLNVMPQTLLQRLRETKLQALFLTNVLGFTGELNDIRDICRENNIILFEDNCESLGTRLHSGKTGNFSLASSFSFYVAHHMSTIEGGAVCTDDAAFAQMLRIVRANGWDRNLTTEQQQTLRKQYAVENEFQAKYTFYDLGYNFRPTEITGFLGRTQLHYLDENCRIRERNYLRFEQLLKNNSDFITFDRSHIAFLSSFAFPMLCVNRRLRDAYVDRFTAAGIEVRPMIAGNMQRQPFYAKYVRRQYELPETDFIHTCGFYCGNYPELTDSDMNQIAACLQPLQ